MPSLALKYFFCVWNKKMNKKKLPDGRYRSDLSLNHHLSQNGLMGRQITSVAGFFDDWREPISFYSIPIYINLEPQPISVSDHASLTVDLTYISVG